jgi:predicted permease
MTDLFLPTMMYAGVTHDDWGWIRTFVRMRPGGSVKAVRDRLQAVYHAVQTERAKGFTGWPKRRLENFLNQTILVLPAAGGLSYMRQEYQRPLEALAALVGLVLLIACANMANLLTDRAAARSREMALRVSIGAGRGRLTQLALVESALLAAMASGVGAVFAWWSAPFVVERIQPADDPARLLLPADWRVVGFGLALTIVVTLLFGLAPALRAAGADPLSALKGGGDPHAKRRSMHRLIAVQAAFCCVVLVVAGLLVRSFDRLANQPTGFSADRLLALDVAAQPKQPPAVWDRVVEHLRELPGVERVALAGWPLLSGFGANGFVSVNGAPAGERLAYFLNVSPGWLETMRIPLIDGRDFRPDDVYPGAAIVNEAFAREYFGGANPVGRWFARGKTRLQVVGLVRDARYRNMREPITPTAYVPFRYGGDETVSRATILVRTAAQNPLVLAGLLRAETPRARPEFRVSNLRTQAEINRSQTLRERLLATLAMFFGALALLLAGIGLYGVLEYSVLQRRREIGIRIAVGAPAGSVVRAVVAEVFAMAVCGAAAGVGLGIVAARQVESLLYGVTPAEPEVLAGAALVLLAMGAAAAIGPVARAVRTDPVAVLKSE